jgi:formylglycine-generating enzyme required for sulfatase activity
MGGDPLRKSAIYSSYNHYIYLALLLLFGCGNTPTTLENRVEIINTNSTNLLTSELKFKKLHETAIIPKYDHPDDAGFGRGNLPAVNISWTEAKAYAVWLSAKTGKNYRLLSESEFEYAVRGGTKTPWFWGGNEDKKKSCEFANLHDEAGKEAHPNYVWSHVLCNDGAAENIAGGKYKPNPFGLHDMIGNVREWVEDCHQAGYAGAPDDGSVRANEGKCEKRVVRGGGWLDGPSTARAAYRYSEVESMKTHQLGFRLARDL